jgi:hypothetical protein
VATFFFTPERAGRGAMKPRKIKRFSQRGAAEFPGIVVMPSPFGGWSIKTEHGRRLVCRSSRQLGRDGMLDENKA